jgi:hypothetical protein
MPRLPAKIFKLGSLAASILFGTSFTTAQPIPFHAEELPPGGVSAWRWHSGEGALTEGEDGALVFSTERPHAGSDNRTAALLRHDYGDILSFVLDLRVDPVSGVEGAGDNQYDFGLSLALDGRGDHPNMFEPEKGRLSLFIRDLAEAGDFGLMYGGENLVLPAPPKPIGGPGHPARFQRKDGSYAFRLLVTPDGEGGTLLKIYKDQFVDPVWEGRIGDKIVAGYIGLFGRLTDRAQVDAVETRLVGLSLRPVDPEQARWAPTPQESVLYALDLDYPGLEAVKAAMDSGDIALATERFAHYLRTRTNVAGPAIDRSGSISAREQRVADLAAENKVIVHKGGPEIIHDFGENPDWAADPYDTGGQFAIYNARMWPWLDMGKAYMKTGDDKYPEAFVHQLNTWLDQLPLRIVAVPGRDPFFIDGVTLEPPLLFTGNMGRRIELTFWQSFEYFKNSPSFDDASMLRMMDYFARNARLVTNPSVFLPWDDSGLHMATGLLQCATMMPEWRESEAWKAVAFERLEATFNAQVHPDGSHASLSTGYGWATIDGYENMFEILERNNLELPGKFRDAIKGMLLSYAAILRPDFGIIDLNDGGWGRVDDKFRDYQYLFPDDAVLDYFASLGADGQAPDWTSRYQPNAGWFVMRTGYGPREKYLFMDGCPFGASHGKQDALQVYLALGDRLLLRNGGRGDYTPKPTSTWTGSTFSFNTLTPNWAGQNRIPRYEQEKAIGFNPPERPWISNADFDYAESVYDAGWFSADERIGGTHTRRIVFLKGEDAPDTGYWVIVDTVKPNSDEAITWRHPWQLTTESFEVFRGDASIETQASGANLKILPVDPAREIEVVSVKGQTEPVLQGWRVHGDAAKPYRVPMQVWESRGESTKAWVLCAKHDDQAEWEVRDIEVSREADGLISFAVRRTDGGKDFFNVMEPEPDLVPRHLNGVPVKGYFQVVRRSADGELEAVLDVPVPE